MLNPYASDDAWKLDQLIKQVDKKDSLRDNLLLAKTKLIADEELRAEKLNQLQEKFRNT